MKRLFILRLIVFLSSFLLFQIELIIGKAILPGFGGSFMVWSTCVFFFQGMLLLGYFYAHAAGRLLNPVKYAYLEMVIVIAPIILFPISLNAITAPAHRLPFAAEIGFLLVSSVGLSFFALSTISVVLQKALAATDLSESANPYFLYGTSNLGSFIALLSYPFLVEPFLDLDVQLTIWETGYATLAALLGIGLLILGRRAKAAEKPAARTTRAAANREIIRRFLFAAAGSAMFLSTTNFITFDVASIPFLWVLPLSIYLLTFVLNFKQKPWRPAWLLDRFELAIIVALFLFFMTLQGYIVPIGADIAGQLVILFIFCMYCQKELHESRPEAEAGLTAFYLVLAAGGFAGSALVSWIIPLVSNSMIEYVASILLAFAAISISAPRRTELKRDYAIALAIVPLTLLWPWTIGYFGSDKSNLVSEVAGILFALNYYFLAGKPRAITLSLVLILLCSPYLSYFRPDRNLLFQERNFYGVYRVYDEEGKRWLRHGATLHGAQYLDPARRDEALMYYHQSAPAGELLASGIIKFHDIGIVGLGTGALSVYALPGQRMDFYELDPDMLDIAQKYFTYLHDSPGRLHFIFGDARQSLNHEKVPVYGLLILDAFSSDSIPLHLLTVQAVADYRRRLAPDGIMLFHISNRHMNFLPVLSADARAGGLLALYKSSINPVRPNPEQSEWVALTASPDKAEILVQQLGWINLQIHPLVYQTRAWTDNYSNLLAAILAK
jgi:spermidine synthase